MSHDSSQITPSASATQLDIELKKLEIQRRAVELPVELAQLGLRGTLTGAIGGMVFMVIISLLAVFPTNKLDITGYHLCIMMGILAAATILYGAFVFQRSASIIARFGRQRELGAMTGDPNRNQTDSRL